MTADHESRYLSIMKLIGLDGIVFSTRRLAVVWLISFLCLCVVFQMLGVPVTLLALLTSDSPIESLSEDLSILPITLKPGILNHISISVEFQRLIYLPIFSTAIFRPPQG